MRVSLYEVSKKQRIFRSVLSAYRPVSLESLRGAYTAIRLTDEKHLHQAKQLHADVYLRYNYIESKDIRDGYISPKKDPYQCDAIYFGVIETRTDSVVAVARFILPKKNRPLPIFTHVLRNVHPTKTVLRHAVEVSAFVKKRGVDSRVLMLLFRAMFVESAAMKHATWYVSCDEFVYKKLKLLFGSTLETLGPREHYLGSYVIPAQIRLDDIGSRMKQSYARSIGPLRGVRRFLYESVAKGVVNPPEHAWLWDRYAHAYDALLVFNPYLHLIDHIAKLATNNSCTRLLDLGCGTGNVTHRILKYNPNIYVDAVDGSAQMLRECDRKTLGENVTTHLSEMVTFLAHSRRQYDVIVMCNSMYTVQDQDRLWRLLVRRLAPGGKLVVANPRTGKSHAAIINHLTSRQALKPSNLALLRVFLYDTIISIIGTTQTYSFTTKTQVEESIRSHGLQLVGEVGYCYGGHKRGIDVIWVAQKPVDHV